MHYKGDPLTYQPEETAPFIDVAGDSWYGRYVQYCVEAGIVSGRGDGIFDPEGNVTGVEFAKMLLCMLGRDPRVYHFIGENWVENVTEHATVPTTLLYRNLDGLDPAGSLDREDTAQMLFNALSVIPAVQVTHDYGDYSTTTSRLFRDEKGMPRNYLYARFALDAFPTVPAQPAKPETSTQ